MWWLCRARRGDAAPAAPPRIRASPGVDYRLFEAPPGRWRTGPPGLKRALRGPCVAASGCRRAQQRALRGTKSSVANSRAPLNWARSGATWAEIAEAPGSENKAPKAMAIAGSPPGRACPPRDRGALRSAAGVRGDRAPAPGGVAARVAGRCISGARRKGSRDRATPSRSARRPGPAGDRPAPFRFRPRRSTASKRSAPRRRGRGGTPASGLR